MRTLARIQAFQIGKLMAIPEGHELSIHNDRLQVMYESQREFQRIVPPSPVDPAERTPEEQMQYILVQAMGLIHEITEAMNETGWKPWASSNHINVENYKKELIDAWHFFLNLMFVVDMTPEELFQGYFQKQNVNRKRVENNYDGVTTKCPKCGRAYDDGEPGLEWCTPATDEFPAWCQEDSKRTDKL